MGPSRNEIYDGNIAATSALYISPPANLGKLYLSYLVSWR